MKNRKVKVLAPASVSNCGPGFDILGFALNNPDDEIIVSLKDKPGIVIKKISGDNGKIPYAVKENTAGTAALSMLKKLNLNIGVEIEIKKKMGLGSGLGSSAASAVGAVVALNELLGNPFKKEDLLEFGMAGEFIASKSIHADNVAPCLLGGFVLIRGYNPIDVVKLESNMNLFTTIIHPQFEIKTAQARKMLKKNIPLKKAITQWGNVAGLVAGLLMNDIRLVSRSINDVIVEPVRAQLIPGFYNIKNAALDKGSIGCSISGSGPSIFALSTSLEDAIAIGKAMKREGAKHFDESKIYVSEVNNFGARVVG